MFRLISVALLLAACASPGVREAGGKEKREIPSSRQPRFWKEDAVAGAEFEKVSGLEIRYRIHRNPGAPKMLLINALPLSVRCWDSTWEELARHFELLAIDVPGFGLSESSPALLSPVAMAGFLEEVMRHVAWTHPIVVGPDIGVPIALALAESRPELIAGIVVFDGPGTAHTHFSVQLQLMKDSSIMRFIARVFYSPRTYLDQVISRAYTTSKPSDDAYREYVDSALWDERFSNALDYLSSYPRDLSAIELQLHSIRVPTLILWGEKDRYVPVENANELAHLIPGSELHIFAGAGHFSQEDAGPLFVAELVAWSRRHFSP